MEAVIGAKGGGGPAAAASNKDFAKPSAELLQTSESPGLHLTTATTDPLPVEELDSSEAQQPVQLSNSIANLIGGLKNFNLETDNDSDKITKYKRIPILDSYFIVPADFNTFKVIGRGSYGLVIAAFLDEEAKEKFYTSNETFNAEGKRTCIAIKKMIDPFRNKFMASRALRELAILKSVNHVNVIQYLYGYTPDCPAKDMEDIFLCSELMYTTLNHLNTKTISHKHISFIVYQIVAGILHLHDHNIFHRDLKPANIAIDYMCKVKILDFGLSRIANDSNMTPYVVTRYYRAPEILIGIPYNEKADIWSVGCILGEMLLKRVLFKGASPLDQLRQIVKVLGSPSDEFMLSIPFKIRNSIKKSWGGAFLENKFDKIFTDEAVSRGPETTQKEIEECKSLLNIMLKMDQADRANDHIALREPYLSAWRQEEELKFMELHSELDFSFEDDTSIQVPDIKQAIGQILSRANVIEDLMPDPSAKEDVNP